MEFQKLHKLDAIAVDYEIELPFESISGKFSSLITRLSKKFDVDRLEIVPLLFQTGYLTITGYEDYIYELSWPSQEVKKSFLNFLYITSRHPL